MFCLSVRAVCLAQRRAPNALKAALKGALKSVRCDREEICSSSVGSARPPRELSTSPCRYKLAEFRSPSPDLSRFIASTCFRSCLLTASRGHLWYPTGLGRACQGCSRGLPHRTWPLHPPQRPTPQRAQRDGRRTLHLRINGRWDKTSSQENLQTATSHTLSDCRVDVVFF